MYFKRRFFCRPNKRPSKYKTSKKYYEISSLHEYRKFMVMKKFFLLHIAFLFFSKSSFEFL